MAPDTGTMIAPRAGAALRRRKRVDESEGRSPSDNYDARAAVRRALTREVVDAFAAFARAIERVLVVKQRSSAMSTFCSIRSLFSRATSEISEMARNLAGSR